MLPLPRSVSAIHSTQNADERSEYFVDGKSGSGNMIGLSCNQSSLIILPLSIRQWLIPPAWYQVLCGTNHESRVFWPPRTDFPAYSDTLGTREKCHCKRGVAVTSVIVSGEVCINISASTSENDAVSLLIMLLLNSIPSRFDMVPTSNLMVRYEKVLNVTEIPALLAVASLKILEINPMPLLTSTKKNLNGLYHNF